MTAVAQQTRAPLLVADGLLRGALSLVQQPKLKEESAQLMKQAANALLKADLPFERLSEQLTIKQPPGDAPTSFDLRAVLYNEVDTLSRSDDILPANEDAIEVTDEIPLSVDLPMEGWPERLGFAFRSALSSLLLQRVAPEDRVAVTIAQDGTSRVIVHMIVAGTASVTTEATAPIQQGQARARRLMRTAGAAIRAATEQHGGTMSGSDGTVYEFTLPLKGSGGTR